MSTFSCKKVMYQFFNYYFEAIDDPEFYKTDSEP
jgi:hypothetical protein